MANPRKFSGAMVDGPCLGRNFTCEVPRFVQPVPRPDMLDCVEYKYVDLEGDGNGFWSMGGPTSIGEPEPKGYPAIHTIWMWLPSSAKHVKRVTRRYTNGRR